MVYSVHCDYVRRYVPFRFRHSRQIFILLILENVLRIFEANHE
jgi:hypothetical protein